MKTAVVAATRSREKGATGGRTAAAVPSALAGAALLVLAAVAGALLPWAELRLHLEARAWPVTEATLRSVSLSHGRHAPADAEARTGDLVLAVVYDYEVDGTVHEGRRASFADRAGPHDRRLKTLYSRLNFALVTGRPVPVSYDPDVPETAVLDAGFDRWRVVPGLVLGLGALLFGLRFSFAALRAVAGRP